ncbi:MAG: GHKL domain-containing protein [Frisingicoccus sp.]|uniref:GHKL domain-containing protein n=1 Tax=Frisingicoccus sp. TaxID=1918627 RepID=UPI00261406A0|nr:GHKL domain-containing protein [Frisingicoccus sp.]MDD6231674.1 GHKL domain-containing protein [Frisingicoccus sp.]
MTEILCPILELCIIVPGIMLAYFPMKSYLRQPLPKLTLWIVPLLLLLSVTGGTMCYARRISTTPVLAVIVLLSTVIYIKTLRISLWKSTTMTLAVCAVFACINSLSRAINAAMLIHLHPTQTGPWFCLRAAICYNVLCLLITVISYYPASHSIRKTVENENFAQIWYVFWVLPLAFIALNLFMIPKYPDTLYTGRVLQGYFVISIALLILLLWFYTVFLMMANSLNRNIRLQQENQLLSMQKQRYENLKAAIEEARQARHDMRHQLNQLSALTQAGDLEKLKKYLDGAAARIPSLDMHFCENRAADSVVGYYCELAKKEGIPFSVQIDLPEKLPIDEIDLCLVLSNLMENALEASMRTDPARRNIKLTSYLHAGSLLLIQIENTYDGFITEKDNIIQSSKRKGNGIGLQSVRHIAEKSGGASTFTYQNGIFCAKIMICR